MCCFVLFFFFLTVVLSVMFVCWLVLCSVLLVIYGLLSFRSLGLHIRGVEENSRSKREGIFQDDECIVKINDAELMDKSFSQWVSELKPFCFTFWSAFCLHLLISFPFYRGTQFLDLSFHVMAVKTSMVSIVVLYLRLSTLDWFQKQKKTQSVVSEPIQQSWPFPELCLLCVADLLLFSSWTALLHTVMLIRDLLP